MAYNKNLYTSADSALDAGMIYDQNLMKMQDEINADVKDGDIVVGLADNLASSYNQYSTGEFIERTTGGTASISDGDGHLILIRGRSTHTGYTAPAAEMTVTNATRGEGEEEITATIDVGTFLAQMQSTSGTFTFSYTSSWNYNPASYGITVVGTPKSGDSIAVTYQQEVRGTITQSTPIRYTSTKWNLYNNSTGRARTLKYSNTYGFGISGTYTSLAFSPTLDGEQTSVTVTDGKFTVPEDGYVFVTGGNATDTAIWMTWSDWTNGYVGDFTAYFTSSVDFTTIMSTYFPNGLLQVGSYADEIDFSLKTATNKVGRLAYSAANLATVEAMSTEYEYDEDYIYYGLETPVVNTIDIDNTVVANDHGLEYLVGSTVPVYAQTLYGVNLKNRLERDVVLKSGDTMTGQLTVSNANITLRNTTVDTTEESSSANKYWDVIHADNGGKIAGYWETCFTQAGTSQTTFRARKTVNGSNVNNGLILAVTKNGNKLVAFDDADAWRTGLNVVNKAGDTMTGNLNVEKSTPGVTLTNPNADTTLTSPTSTNTWSFYNYDKNALVASYLETTLNTEGRVQLSIAARKKVNGTNISNGLYIRVLADGTMSIGMSSPAAWRSALNLGTSGAFPITVEQGGTGQTEIENTTTIASVATAASGYEITTASFKRWGKLGQLYLAVKKTTAVTTATDSVCCTVVSGKRPASSAGGTSNNSNTTWTYVMTNGEVHLYGTWPANTTKYIFSTYILP